MSLTKTQLGEQVADLQKQVTSLQDELVERSFQLSAMEALASSYEAELGTLVSEIVEDAGDHAELLDMTDLAAGLASQLGWTISMVQSIGLLDDSTPLTRQTLVEVVLAASEPFWEGYTQGLYEPAQLLPEEPSEPITVKDPDFYTAAEEAVFSDEALAEVLQALGSVPEMEQEVPDEEPDYYSEDGEAFYVEPLVAGK